MNTFINVFFWFTIIATIIATIKMLAIDEFTPWGREMRQVEAIISTSISPSMILFGWATYFAAWLLYGLAFHHYCTETRFMVFMFTYGGLAIVRVIHGNRSIKIAKQEADRRQAANSETGLLHDLSH